ncbi:MAG: hypothetical protein EBS66_19010, partial [Betaproteobacteria bacterium]|nr:hypothetical protein [Betaproteobacteria bacterium]
SLHIDFKPQAEEIKSLCVAPSSLATTACCGVSENAQFMEKTKVMMTANGKSLRLLANAYLWSEFIC